MILDTSYVLDLVAKDEDAFRKGVELQEANVTRWVPTPVLFECYYGAEYLDDDDERRLVRNALGSYPTVDVTDDLARTAGRLLARADRDASGDSGVEVNDAYVAAVAEVLDEPVLTSDPEDFETLGVAVETYR